MLKPAVSPFNKAMLAIFVVWRSGSEKVLKKLERLKKNFWVDSPTS